MINDILKKLSHEQKLTLGEYGNIIIKRSDSYRDENKFKLQGYLTALKDLKIINETEKRNLYTYYTTRRN